MSFLLVTLSGTKASIEQLEKVNLTQHEAYRLMILLRESFNCRGIWIFSTCNRLEIYWEGENILPHQIISLLFIFKNLPIATDLVNKFTTLHDPKQIAQHLTEVVLGLHSPVFADKQVIGQFRQAYKNSLQCGLQGSLLERLAQLVFRIHKKVKNETDLKFGSESWSYLSLQLIKQHFAYLHNKSLLIVGAGRMANEIVKYIPGYNFKEICIVNRTDAKAMAIATSKNIDWLPWSRLSEEIGNYDAVILAVNSIENLLSQSRIISPVLWIDLGLPVNVRKSWAKTRGVKLFGIEDFTDKIIMHRKQKKDALPAVEKIIDQEIMAWLNWLAKRQDSIFI